MPVPLKTRLANANGFNSRLCFLAKEEINRLEKIIADVAALCAQEGNDGEPWDSINEIIERRHR